MSTNKKLSHFLVDDDELYVRVLEMELGQDNDYKIIKFATGEQCLGFLPGTYLCDALIAFCLGALQIVTH